MNKLIFWIKENKFLVGLFLISTAYFIYQHALSVSWDFASYVLNARYWFFDGYYFELLRPPLMSLLIGVFSFVGERLAEYVYIVFVSFLFFYSSIRLAKVLKFNAVVFYAISLNAYLLSYGLINGTELLFIAFLELGVAFLLEGSVLSGLFLGLSALSRYTGLVLFPLLFFHWDVKKILKSLGLFFGVVFIWFAYNFYAYGNFFTSVADQYANNVLYREYLYQLPQLTHFVTVLGLLIPFFLVGLFVCFRRVELKSFFTRFKVEVLMFILFVYFVWSYVGVPVKNERYLFGLVLPAFYFSYIGLEYLVGRFKKDWFVGVGLVLFLINLLFALFSGVPYDSSVYDSASDSLDEFGLSGCAVMSNGWVLFNYAGVASQPSPRLELVNESLDNGYVLAYFKDIGESLEDLDSFDVVYEDDEYVIIGDGCVEDEVFDDSYLEQLNSDLFRLYDYHININPCFVLFHDYSFFEKSCNFVNMNGFSLDENRILE